MDRKKHYLVYKTTCLLNGKIYIGKHQTDNLDDDYLGSGILIQRAIKKYGRENFKREVLFECSSKEEMDAKEAELVNEDFLKRKDVYNIKLGGAGGFDFINSTGINNIGNNAILGAQAWIKIVKNNPSIRTKIQKRIKRLRKRHPEKFPKIDPQAFRGKHHTEKSKQKMREKNTILLRGERNGSFGTVWIYNETLEQNKKVKKEQVETFLNQDWKLGRKMNFHK